MCFESYMAPIYRPAHFYIPPTQLHANRVIPGQAVCGSPRSVFIAPNQRNYVPPIPVYVDSGSHGRDPRANLGARFSRFPVNPPTFNFWNRMNPLPRFPWGMAGHRVTVGR